MIYILSNVVRNPESLYNRLSNFNFIDPVFIHLNSCSYMNECIDFFKNKVNFYVGVFLVHKNNISGLEFSKKYNFERKFCYKYGFFYEFIGDDIIKLDKQLDYNEINGFYPKNKYMTTGFASYLYFKKYYNQSVYTVNFYGPSDKTTYHWNQHDFEYEDEYLNNINSKIFI